MRGPIGDLERKGDIKIRFFLPSKQKREVKGNGFVCLFLLFAFVDFMKGMSNKYKLNGIL